MTEQQKAPAATEAQNEVQQFAANFTKKVKPGTKIARVLAGFAAGHNYNRFEAERQLHDHALHSTVSAIQADLGIPVARKFETVPGFQGAPTRVCRYWLTSDAREKAMRVLMASGGGNE